MEALDKKKSKVSICTGTVHLVMDASKIMLPLFFSD